jgi:hypothetical protein
MAAPGRPLMCATAAEYRVAGYHVGRCSVCGQVAPVYGGRLIAHPTLRRVVAETGATA